MPGVLQLFAVVAMSFACVLHLVMSSCALCVCIHACYTVACPMHMSHVLSPLLSFFLMFLQVTLFPPPLMFIYFLMILFHALYLSVKYHPFWSCFGRVQKWLTFESISNLNYSSILKNAQSNLFKFYTNSRLQGYSHISPNPRHIPVLFGLYFSV